MANESRDDWDYEHAEVIRPTRKARAVVSVAFDSADFHRVAEAAERAGKKLSTYIREAVLAPPPTVCAVHEGMTEGNPAEVHLWRTPVNPRLQPPATKRRDVIPAMGGAGRERETS